MTITPVPVFDAIHVNLGHLPPGTAAGYTTGTPDIRWTTADWNAHPNAVRICQDAGASDPTADVLDIERGAATNTEAASWYRHALASYHAATRPGQRSPALYTSASNVTPLVNQLIADGVAAGPCLWVANWNLSDPQASAEVAAAGGPYPIIGVQWNSFTFYDASVFSRGWLTTVSRTAPPPTGPYRHVADGHRSAADIAAGRGTSVQHLLQVSAGAYTPADLAAAGKLHLPAGLPYYTSNP